MPTKTVDLPYWFGFGAVVAGLIFMLIRKAAFPYMVIPIVVLGWEVLRRFKVLPRFKYLRYELSIFAGAIGIGFLIVNNTRWGSVFIALASLILIAAKAKTETS